MAMRDRGSALGTATNWICNFIVVEITPIGISSLGWKFYIIWTVFNGAFVPLVYLFYPETAGRTLEDIDRYFIDHNDIFVFKDKVSDIVFGKTSVSSATDSAPRSRHPRSVLSSILRTKRTKCAVIAVSMHELRRWQWRGTQTACRSTSRARRRRRRRTRRPCEYESTYSHLRAYHAASTLVQSNTSRGRVMFTTEIPFSSPNVLHFWMASAFDHK
jgi:hypothetical protein